MLKKVLFIDDQVDEWIGLMNDFLNPLGFQVIGEANPRHALSSIKLHSPDAILLDLAFGTENLGKDILLKIKKKYPSKPPVMIMTITMDKAEYNADDYVLADDRYFKDFLKNKDDFEELSKRLNAIIARAEMVDSKKSSAQAQIEDSGFIVGESPIMREAFDVLIKVADSAAAIFITGESGTGKEMMAQSIVKRSRRSAAPFIVINCGAIPENLLESELFGFEKGAFTGAEKTKIGKFELANGGTLFLDEIADPSPSLQVKILRALQQKEIERIGGTRPIAVDVRIIAATNKDISEEIGKGSFREDLYYRLNTITIHLPPLRERKNDFKELYEYFIQKKSKSLARKISPKLRGDVLELFKTYEWPGNIREFGHAIERAILLTSHQVLQLEDFKNIGREEHKAMVLDDIDTIVQNMFDGQLKWNNLKGTFSKGSNVRRDIFKGLIEKWILLKGFRPKSKDLANLLNTTEGNIRQKMQECGLKLRDWDKARKNL